MNGPLTGAWVIDVMAIAGTVFLAFLTLLFPAWHLVDRIRHQRRDAEEIARLMPKPSDFAETGTLKAVGK